MTESIESFVNKLQVEGIQAGEEAAEEIRKAAESEAENIVNGARQAAEQIKGAAQEEAADLLARARGELELAVRDTVLKLNEILNKSLQGILSRASEAALSDTDFLKSVIKDLVMQYAQADLSPKGKIEINVTEEEHERLSKWVASELSMADDSSRVSVSLARELKQAGFEFTVSEGTIEITRESVSAVLAELVGPRLKQLLSLPQASS